MKKIIHHNKLQLNFVPIIIFTITITIIIHKINNIWILIKRNINEY